MNKEMVVLVDKNDNEIGTMEKMEAHRVGKLHRAVSVFIVNSKGHWLLQRRAMHKYHSAGLWTNAACTHPYPGEQNQEAAQRRLFEEMGMKVELSEQFSFTYNEKLDKNLTEHEFDHIFLGFSETLPAINFNEIIDYKYVTFDFLLADISENPENYTIWFRHIFKKVQQQIIA